MVFIPLDILMSEKCLNKKEQQEVFRGLRNYSCLWGGNNLIHPQKSQNIKLKKLNQCFCR